MLNPICQHWEQKQQKKTKEITQNNVWDIWVVVGDREAGVGGWTSYILFWKWISNIKARSGLFAVSPFIHHTFEPVSSSASWYWFSGPPSASRPAGTNPSSEGCQPGHSIRTTLDPFCWGTKRGICEVCNVQITAAAGNWVASCVACSSLLLCGMTASQKVAPISLHALGEQWEEGCQGTGQDCCQFQVSIDTVLWAISEVFGVP